MPRFISTSFPSAAGKRALAGVILVVIEPRRWHRWTWTYSVEDYARARAEFRKFDAVGNFLLSRRDTAIRVRDDARVSEKPRLR